MKIYLLRHGETEYNTQRRYQGWTDIPLSEDGLKRLKKADFDPEAVFVSPLKRARQTASALFPSAAQIVIPELMEMNFGIFEGKNHNDMMNDPFYREWVEGMCEGKIPDGESKAEFGERVCEAIEKLIDSAFLDNRELVVIVAHGGTQMAAMERFALPERGYYQWLGPLAGGYVLETDDETWRASRKLRLTDTVQYLKDKK